jgi:uncharacterized protein YbjT (DUF2867 family)
MRGRLLLTGATGFIGSRLHDRLSANGWQVRCLTRDVDKARAAAPTRDWVPGDVRDEASLDRALSGCQTAFFLVHGMADLSPGWVEREITTARQFSAAAARAGLERVLYLGGVEPQGEASDHLHARLETGRVLRGGSVPCVELRAAMIVGTGSASWTIVRDLAARLPAMVLPHWLSHRSEPVAVDDVVQALMRATELPVTESVVWDLPGPEALSGTEILLRVAALRQQRPFVVRVPFVSPRLSSHWIRLVTRADYRLAAELVQGLTHDLIATHRGFWASAGLPDPIPLEEAARRAFASEGEPSSGARVVESVARALSRKPRGKATHSV